MARRHYRRGAPPCAPPMHLALADCDLDSDARTPTGVASEAPLHEALRARGVTFECPAWDDPGVDWGAFDAILIRLTWTYHHRPRQFRAWLDRVAALVPVFNPPEIVRWNMDKRYLQDLERAGVPIAPTVWLPRGSAVDLAGTLESRGWSTAFAKPVIGATASDTMRMRTAEERLEGQAFLEAQVARQDMFLQPYLRRVETEGEVSLMVVEGEVVHAVRKTPVPGDYRVQDDFDAVDERIDVEPELARLARAAVAAVPRPESLLYARVDFLFLDDGAPVLNELELIEPMFFMHHEPRCGAALADGLLGRIEAARGGRGSA